ncbi:MAG: biotin/lipoyl-containing protein, partial [Alphaproteobacteria bacterium]
MPVRILMPALSPTMTEGTLAKWHVKEGDEVSAGDVIAEIETDKATMEVEAVDEGKVGRLLVSEGTEGVAVNAPIALLLEEGEDASALEAAAAAGTAKPAPARQEAELGKQEAAPAPKTEAKPAVKPAPQAAPAPQQQDARAGGN